MGVVFRGSLWLDGVFTCLLELGRRGYLLDLAGAIRQSRQYSQVHAVILSKEELVPGQSMNISALSHKIRLPVISVVRKNVRCKAKDCFPINVKGRTISVRVQGMGQERTREIFSIGCAGNHRVPEAVRVADLLANHLA